MFQKLPSIWRTVASYAVNYGSEFLYTLVKGENTLTLFAALFFEWEGGTFGWSLGTPSYVMIE